MIDPRDRMPDKIYTVGDTIRLEITLVSASNIEEVHVFYFLAGNTQGTSEPFVSFEDSINDTHTLEKTNKYELAAKEHTVTLSCMVDREHTPGSYRLGRVILRTAGGETVDTDFVDIPSTNVETFRIAQDPISVESIEIRVAPPED